VATQQASAATTAEPVNEVRLRGRWVGAEERRLPSGDELVVARVVVPRAGGGVDTLNCAVWAAAVRRRAVLLGDGDAVEVTGSLRRRFWRTQAGAASRYEVEVTSLRRLRSTGSRPR
jgi:single-strand DNA-binding protein